MDLSFLYSEYAVINGKKCSDFDTYYIPSRLPTTVELLLGLDYTIQVLGLVLCYAICSVMQYILVLDYIVICCKVSKA